jgi:spore coat protein CotH
MMGAPGGPLEMLAIREVQSELKLDDEQRKRIEDLAAQTQEKTMAAFREAFEDPDSLDEESREKRVAQVRIETGKLAQETLAKISALLKPEQEERFQQLRLQREGISALVRPEIAKQLELSDEQRSKIEDLEAQQRPFFGPPQRRQQSLDEALAILNDSQKAELAAMKGAEFKFPEPRFGFGGPMGQERELVAKFDKDSDGRLNDEERRAARESIKNEGPRGFGPGGGGPGRGGPGGRRGFGPPGGPGRESELAKPGKSVAVSDVQPSDAPFYDPHVLRTIFLNFENKDWEAEMADFNNTDVDVPATMIVDGKTYSGVGVHFRGMSSFFTVPAGSKRSLNVSVDFTEPDQRLYGYKTLNLLNSHEDPTFLHTVLYLDAARSYIPAPKANLVRVVINGESWGLYTNAQQFNKEFIKENFKTDVGARWKVPGSPGGRGGLEYVGDNIADYKRTYQIKSKDKAQSWKALVNLCKVLNETPTENLEQALEPILDIDGALWFLALENALINSDGYWVRASDYSIYLDPEGRFHILPHDANETFQPGMGPGMRPGMGFGGPGRGGAGGFGGPKRRRGEEGPSPEDRAGGPPDRRPGQGRPEDGPPEARGGRGFGGPGGRGVELDPLVGLDDATKPLRSRLLAVPSLKTRYLEHVRTIANDWLDWDKLGPVVEGYVTLIEPEIKDDTKKLSSYAEFLRTVGRSEEQAAPGGRGGMTLREFVEKRRQEILNSSEIKALPAK